MHWLSQNDFRFVVMTKAKHVVSSSIGFVRDFCNVWKQKQTEIQKQGSHPLTVVKFFCNRSCQRSQTGLSSRKNFLQAMKSRPSFVVPWMMSFTTLLASWCDYFRHCPNVCINLTCQSVLTYIFRPSINASGNSEPSPANVETLVWGDLTFWKVITFFLSFPPPFTPVLKKL